MYAGFPGYEMPWCQNRFEKAMVWSVPVAEMAMEKRRAVIDGRENGVSSFEGEAYLKEQGVWQLITDHHLPPGNTAEC